MDFLSYAKRYLETFKDVKREEIYEAYKVEIEKNKVEIEFNKVEIEKKKLEIEE